MLITFAQCLNEADDGVLWVGQVRIFRRYEKMTTSDRVIFNDSMDISQTNRMVSDLENVIKKVFKRDLFHEN